MKKTMMSGFIVAVMALNPLLASAAADNKYPAANFEPTVIYIDKAIVAENSAVSAFDSKYPAANFEPKVVYIDKDLVEQTEEQFDPKYPAAYFKPKVIYP